MQERRDAGKLGYRTGGMQERRDGGKLGYRTGKGGFGTGGIREGRMLDDECRTGGMHN